MVGWHAGLTQRRTGALPTPLDYNTLVRVSRGGQAGGDAPRPPPRGGGHDTQTRHADTKGRGAVCGGARRPLLGVGGERLELSRVSPTDPKSVLSANFSNRPDVCPCMPTFASASRELPTVNYATWPAK